MALILVMTVNADRKPSCDVLPNLLLCCGTAGIWRLLSFDKLVKGLRDHMYRKTATNYSTVDSRSIEFISDARSDVCYYCQYGALLVVTDTMFLIRGMSDNMALMLVMGGNMALICVSTWLLPLLFTYCYCSILLIMLDTSFNMVPMRVNVVMLPILARLAITALVCDALCYV